LQIDIKYNLLWSKFEKAGFDNGFKKKFFVFQVYSKNGMLKAIKLWVILFGLKKQV